MTFSKGFKNRVMARYERYDMQVGILEDKPHRVPRTPRALGSLQGGPVRKMGMKTRGTVSGVAERMSKRYDFLKRPFRKRTSRDLRALVKAFFNLASHKTRSYSYTETALRAVVRNPILQGKYGKNSVTTRWIKGFSRVMIDTGQMFKAIKAKVRIRRSRVS